MHRPPFLLTESRMAVLPTRPESPTVAAMRATWEARPGRLSRRLGASSIGEECERRLFYQFRWANAGERQFDGRMLRLFDRGNREEAVFIAELRAAGLEVWDRDPSTGEQFEFKAVAGHFVAKIDGACRGVLEAPAKLHVLSFKTANDSSWKSMQKDGPGSKYEAQSQVEMRLAGIDRTLFLVANKNDDQVHGERIRLDTTKADAIIDKATRITFAAEPPGRISEDAAFYKCKQCPAAKVCHGDALPAVSCRTCLHATPEADGDGRWSCALAPAGESIPHEFQARGCARHLYIPALLAKWGAVEDADESDSSVEYKAADGLVFRNAITPAPGRYTSRELAACTPRHLRDADFLRIRDGGMCGTQGVIVTGEAA